MQQQQQQPSTPPFTVNQELPSTVTTSPSDLSNEVAPVKEPNVASVTSTTPVVTLDLAPDDSTNNNDAMIDAVTHSEAVVGTSNKAHDDDGTANANTNHDADDASPPMDLESAISTAELIPSRDGDDNTEEITIQNQIQTCHIAATTTIPPPPAALFPTTADEAVPATEAPTTTLVPEIESENTENDVTAPESKMMVVEADEDTSHSTFMNDTITILPTSEEMIMATATTAEDQTTIQLQLQQQQQQQQETIDDESDAVTTTTISTAPHQPQELTNYDNHHIPLLLSPLTPSPNISKHRPTKKLLLLISTNSIDRQVKVRQDLVQTALTAANIEYDVIDGSIQNIDNNNNKGSSNVALRNELFALSGLRGVYPQFFIVNLVPHDDNAEHGAGAGTTFWGTFQEFQHVNDDGQLQQVFGSFSSINNSSDTTISSPENKTISRNLYPSDALPSVAQLSNQNEGVSTDQATTLTVPDDIYEKFSQQIQRIEENYQAEREETEKRCLQERQHQQQLYQQCEQEKRDLEEKLSTELKHKDEQLQEMYRRNEGYRLKLDVLKREVTGTQELVQGRDQELQKANQKYLTDLRSMEKQFNNAEKSAIKFQEEAQSIQAKLDKTEIELQTSKQEYEVIKERAKDVAAELKHRRSECRKLQDTVAELTDQNNHLKATVHSLEERLNHQGLNQSDKDKEIEALRAKLTESKHESKTIELVWQEKLAKSENVLTEYKKRAQHSLSMSNSRTAAAVQAREEAELDARAARSTADAALERSAKAEVESREAIAKAKVAVKAIEDERDEAIRNFEQINHELRAAETIRIEKERDLESVLAEIRNNDAEIERLRASVNEADTKVASLQQKIVVSTNTIDDLREEIIALRDELQRATIAAVNAVPVQKNDDTRGKKYTPSQILMNGSHEDAEVDDTLAALRMELREANDAIDDLKNALKNAIEMNEQQQQRLTSTSDTNAAIMEDSGRPDVGHPNSADTGTIPLFYAMEKQAELKTARTEMNRLASLLADVQSEKMEAYEAMEEMRRKLEEAESRLKRNDKLGFTNSANVTGSDENNSNASAVNIEYLKHILLRFMNAKTSAERKTLIPVIGAVLELTPDEVQTATQNIERNSASIVASNGSNLFSFLS